MMATLIRKEISEHWIPTVALIFFLGICSLLMSVYVWFLEAGSALDGHRLFTSFFLVLAALFVTNRLVTREYRGQTQLFLEALPVTRPAMISVKLFLGWCLINTIALLNLFWLAYWSHVDEPITPRFLGLLTVRTIGFVTFVYLFAFMMSMLGRYKIPLYLAMFIGLVTFLQTTGYEFERFGPIGLVWDRMEYEVELIPWTQIGVATALCVGLLAVIYGLALVREGAIAGMLAEKMSQREKVFIAVCLLAGMAISSLADKLKAPAPFELFDMYVITEDRVQVATSTSDELSTYLAQQLNAVCEYLHIDSPPKVWVTERQDLDVHRFERGELKDHRSLLLRANVRHPDFDRHAFSAFMIHEFLDVHTRGRVRTEAKMWYWDGFGLYWMNRPLSNEKDDKIALRAAVAYDDQPLGEDHVRAWRQYRRVVGDDLAQAVAAHGIDNLVRACGQESSQALLTKVFEGNVGDDLRATWFEWRNSNERLFAQTTSIKYQDFLKRWFDDLASQQQSLQSAIKSFAKPQGKLELVQGPQKTQLHYAINTAALDPANSPTNEAADRVKFVSLLYKRLKPFEVEPTAYEIQRVDIDILSPTGEVDELFDRGESVLATLRLFDRKLGCERISGWQLLRVP